MSSGRRDSCHELFRQLNILMLQSQYIYSLYFYLLLRTGINFYPIQKFEISIQGTILIYICL